MTLEGLIHKRKTVSDLIRFIENTSDKTDYVERNKTPNFSILLGAGASVTSGIRSGQTLINEWKKQVYEESENKEHLNLESFFSSGNAPDWYEESNAYSALFENRYDLQRHRRMFVEHEVSGKTPSIGYAYLVKLIECGFFNTVFTTNFDDLLNEAFYRFSKNRPIVCAHDSSISGVTVTSSRPKIIKLHGDYLFDNIKTTLRETESLEMNMKMKFQEFAKDFGLIVVGYAGHDRSIMDILTYLLQHEDYFKNGIYWCIRKEDKDISAELKRLLWRDRVYYIEIDGFDELFAEINHKLNNGALPIDDAFLSRRHQESIIKDLTDNKYINNSSSKYLLEDCKKLKSHFEDNIANDFLEFIREKNKDHSKYRENRITKRKSKYSKMSQEEISELNYLVTEAFGLGHVQSVFNKLEEKDIFSLKDSEYKIQLLELQADLKKSMSDKEVKKIFDELIRLDCDNERYYEIAANKSKNKEQTLQYLKKAVEKFSNDYYIINLYVSELIDYYEDLSSNRQDDARYRTIKPYIEQSLSLEPCIDNSAYTQLLRYYKFDNKNNNENYKAKCKEISDKVWDLSHYHPQTIKILRVAQSSNFNEEAIRTAIEFYLKADDCKALEKLYVELILLKSKNQKSFLETYGIIKEFENKYTGSESYKFQKAQILLKFEYFEDALKLIEEINSDEDTIKMKMEILSYQGKTKELDTYFESLKNKKEFETCYLECKDDYKSLVDLFNNIKTEKDGKFTTNELSTFSYALLMEEKYQEVTKLLKPYYDNPKLADGFIIVNFLFAQKKLGHNIKKQINEKIIANKYIEYTDEVLLGARCINGDKEEAHTLLCRIIKKEPLEKYHIKEWPVLSEFMKEEKFKKHFNLEQHYLSELEI